jgi:hypothetical protein
MALFSSGHTPVSAPAHRDKAVSNWLKIGSILVANATDRAIPPPHKSHQINDIWIFPQHDMEEVNGSIPIRALAVPQTPVESRAEPGKEILTEPKLKQLLGQSA